MDYTNYQENLEKVKQSVTAFEKLKSTTEELRIKVVSAGYNQRNKLISHVYSGYNEHEDLIKAKARWDLLVFEHNVHNKLIDFLITHRDMYGYFPHYKNMIADFDGIINCSVRMEEFEIATILKKWRDEFPNP
jgi:hypothetical protein